MGKINVLIVEDHELVAEGLEQLARNHPDVSVIERAVSREDALEILSERVDIDLVLMDLFLGKSEDHIEPEGLQAIRQINRDFNRNPVKKIKTIVVTIANEGKWIKKAYDMANGYVLKKTGSKELLKAIDKVMDGGRYFEDEVRKSMDDYMPDPNLIPEEPVHLTAAELEILKMISMGFNTEDIARFRKCRPGTVETHKTNIYKKLGAANAAQAVSIAKDRGLI